MNPKDWPALPDEITRDGPYRVYKGGRYAVYDDGNSAETPYQTDRANALEARLRDTAAALQELVASGVEYDAGKYLVVQVPHIVMDDARALLAQLRTEGLT